MRSGDPLMPSYEFSIIMEMTLYATITTPVIAPPFSGLHDDFFLSLPMGSLFMVIFMVKLLTHLTDPKIMKIMHGKLKIALASLVKMFLWMSMSCQNFVNRVMR